MKTLLLIRLRLGLGLYYRVRIKVTRHGMVQVKLFLDRAKAGMTFRVRMWFYLSTQWMNG